MDIARRHDRHDRPGVPRPDRRLRPLPRPQVRPDPADRLLPAARRSSRASTDDGTVGPPTRTRYDGHEHCRRGTPRPRAESADEAADRPHDIEAKTRTFAPTSRRSATRPEPRHRTTRSQRCSETGARTFDGPARRDASGRARSDREARAHQPKPAWRWSWPRQGAASLPQTSVLARQPAAAGDGGSSPASSRSLGGDGSRHPACAARRQDERPAARAGQLDRRRRHNPLTARVMVNRVWQHHFGRGLVAHAERLRHPRRHARRTPNCSTGSRSEFVADGWSSSRCTG